jgi:hypothetical protein
MKYDDASWHYGGDFPEDLPESAGATHIALFVAWAMLNGLAGDLHVEAPHEIEELRSRSATPVDWFIRWCDEKFTDEDLSAEGNAFALAYYASSSGLLTSPGHYLADYEKTFAGVRDLYSVPSSWESYDRLTPVLARRFKAWSSDRGRKPWFRLWPRS